MTSVTVSDAYVRGGTGGTTWSIGTKAVEVTYQCDGGLPKLVGFTNKLTDPPCDYVSKDSAIPLLSLPDESDSAWRFEKGTAVQVTVGGRPAAQLKLSLAREGLRITLCVIAYPGTSVLRQWIEIENTGTKPIAATARPFSIALNEEDAASLMQYWMVGGNSGADHGIMHSAAISTPYQKTLEAQATADLMPWTAFQRVGSSGDGWFLALEYLANWKLGVDYQPSSAAVLTVDIPDLDAVQLAPGQKIDLPPITIGAFAGSLDDMGRRSYDWQYEYAWDYTNMDFYARPKWAVPWFFCAQNIQEQFGERLGYLDMQTDMLRAMGFEMLWDDAGWALHRGWPEESYSNVFKQNYEGPDYSLTLRYLAKAGMGWLAWLMGRPSSGVMDNKIGSWGNFEWRTDGVGFPDWAADNDLRRKIVYFLENHPRCSFHTCSGGSRYAHTFEIQRFANTNYFSDCGRGEQSNYYFSYIEPPDKWTDIIEPWNTKGKYAPDTARTILTMVPFWGLKASPDDQESIRKDIEIYHYLLREGVAGRWSYMFHPAVKGDTQFYYSQRTNHGRTKACIILKHKAPGEIVVFPRELLPEHEYVVGFDSTCETTLRTGADLMANGIAIKSQPTGELIYLGLPKRPRSGADKTPPSAPGTVFTRHENNIGHSGVGIYWSPGSDDNWVSYYEIRRQGELIGRTAVGTYYFDHSIGWDPNTRYFVRTIDGDGNASPWTESKPTRGEPLAANALGSLFPERGREGWFADTTTDSRTYTPMTFVLPAKTSSADEGGTPNAPGGVEGYWEGAGQARIGRAWQQASKDTACIRSWVAPQPGSIRIIGRVMKEWYRQEKGQPLSVRILHGDKQIWPESGLAKVPLNDLVGLTHDLTVNVSAGDAIRFVLDKGSDSENDIIGWMPRIVYVEDADASDAASVVRILCGAKKPYTDHNGNVWSADCFYSGGRTASTKAVITDALPTEHDQTLYQSRRQGKDFSYSIPVEPGLYAVRLKFAEPKYEWIYERPFNVSINGREILRNFDICQDMRGFRKADERVFRYVAPNADGKIVLRFTGGFDPAQKTDNAIVQAIEVLPEFKPVVRVDCGSDTDFVDWNSFIWSADSNFTGGQAIHSASAVTQASPTPYDQAIYQTARAGKSLCYSFKLPQGLYTVHLKFAELWLSEIGKRPMDIEINGHIMRKGWDPGTAAGELGMAADIRQEHITPDKDGNIVIRVTTAGMNDAILQAIEIE